MTPTEVFTQRAAKLALIRTGAKDEVAKRWVALRAYYRDHPVQFINDWGTTFEPRNVELRLPAILPFILWPKQCEFIQWLYDRWTGREDGAVLKSRDMGVSWQCVAFAVWMWDFHPGAVIGFGSRKEEYVDDSTDPKSLFWKVRHYIDWLPVELRPAGYDVNKHAPYMKISNPELGGVIVGEAGKNIGRGARTSIYFKDESAFYEQPEIIEAALSQTSNCKIDVSTPNGPAGPFYKKVQSAVVPVFRFPWTDDPRKDEAWYAEQKRKLDPVVLAQEVDMDFNASTNNAYISGALIQAAHAVPPASIEAMGAWIVGVDAAHMGDDKSVIQGRKGRFTAPSKRYGQMDGPALAGAVMQYCNGLIGFVAAIVIELDGPGVSCYDQLMLKNEWGWRVVGVHTGARRNDDANYNLKALLWNNAKQYLKQPPVYIPAQDADGNDSAIASQIGDYRYTYRDGVLLMEAKKEYKKRAGGSPDDGDAWILTHIPGELMPERPEANQSAVPSVKTSFPGRMIGMPR